jgi:hypothetical protein
MKKLWQKLKPVLIIAFWVICSGGVMILLGSSMMRQHHLPFQRITINIDDDNNMLFIDESDVLRLLKDHQVNPEKIKPLNAINYEKLENIIETNPFVESAQMSR